jgi:hypothetical protein
VRLSGPRQHHFFFAASVEDGRDLIDAVRMADPNVAPRPASIAAIKISLKF